MIGVNKYKNKGRKKRIVLIIEYFLLGLLSLISILLLSLVTEPISTDEADALYGGETNLWGYPFAGYINDYSSIFTRQVCGITYLSSTTAISAAHCFQDDGIYYVGNMEYQSSPETNVPIKSYFLHPNWNSQTLRGDVAYISLDKPIEGLDSYAQIATPVIGCDYEVLAYGSRDEKSLSNYDLRRSAKVCIEAVLDDRFYLKSPDGGVCFGDSGSPIFVKDTNKLVGVISAITADEAIYSTENCFVNNQAVATRADTIMELVSSTPQTDQSCPAGSGNVCEEKEVCRSNKCMTIDDFVYISALDYRSANFALSGLSSTAGKIILSLSAVFFVLILLVRVRGTKRLSSGVF